MRMIEMKWPGLIAGALLASAVYATVDSSATLFKDPLDQAAAKSSLAPKSQMRAVTKTDQGLVAVGIRGHIMVSNNSDSEWHQASVPVSVDLNAVTFIDNQRGWAVGHDAVVLYTDNGGKYWYKRFDSRLFDNIMIGHYQKRVDKGETALEPFVKISETMAQKGIDKVFLDVYFDSNKHGFVVGPFGLLLQSLDGGLTWAPFLDRIDNPQQAHLNSIRKIGDDLYIAGEMGKVWRYNPTTNRFDQMAPTGTKGSLFGLVGDKDALIVYGLRGRAFKSTDQGRSWVESRTGVTAGLSSATMLDNGHIVMVTQAGHVLVSKDKGSTFAVATPPKQLQYSGITPIENNRVSIVGLNGISSDTIN